MREKDVTRRPVRFSTKIRRLLSLFGFIAFCTIFAVSAFHETWQLKGEISTVMKGAAQETEGLLRDTILQHRRYIQEVIRKMPVKGDKAVQRYFAENLSLLSPEDGYFILNREGRVILASKKAKEFVGLDFSHLAFVRQEGEISSVHQSLVSLRPVVTLKYPLAGGRLLLIEKDLFAMAPLVRHISIPAPMEEGFIFLLSDNGTVVYHPDSDLAQNRYPLGFELRNWSKADAFGLRRYTYRGKQYVCYRQPVSPPDGWFFYAAMPASELTRMVVLRLFYEALAIGAVAVMLIIALQAVINRRVSRPISRIADHLSRVNPLEENGACQVEIESDTLELVQILEACERMASNIKASGRQLAEREELFRTVIEFATDWAFWLSPAEDLLYVSPACTALTGFTPEDFYRDPALMGEIIHPEDRKVCASHVHQAANEQPHKPMEFRIITKDGEVRWMSHVCRPIYDPEGEFLGVRGSNSDITARKQAEQVLQESEERFRGLVEQASDGILVHDLEGHILDANRSGCRMLGYNCQELLQMRFPDIVRNGSLDEFQESWLALRTDQPAMFEGLARRKDGSTFPLEVRLGLVQWGNERQVLAIARDITARKRAEEELAAEKELLSVTLRSIGDGVITTNKNGKVLMLSKVAEMLTGWRQEEAVGRSLAEVFHVVDPETGERCENPVNKVLQTGQIVTLPQKTVLLAKNGVERIVADSGAPIRDKESRIIGVVLVFRDVTERQRLEEEAHKAHKLESLGVLAGGIAHDFNNLLTGILGNLSMAGINALPDSELAAQLAAAEKASLRARDLTQQLLTFAKGGAPIKEVASIADLVRESAEFSLRGAKVNFTLTVADDLWPVEVDPSQISQVINNLMLNAMQAMPGGGTVKLDLANVMLGKEIDLPLEAGPYVRVVVIDQGLGIPEEHLRDIFDPYFSTKQEGSGLGLASSYSIIKRHGGHISVRSESDQGATFSLYLPAAPQEVVPPAKPPEALHGGKARVLVMDDEKMIRELARAVLERLGYEAGFAVDGEEALRLYERAREAGAPYDAVIMDLTIPGGMGGQEAVQKLLAKDPAAKVVVSSGYAQDPIMANYSDYGFAAVLAKPYSVQSLSKVLHDLLRNESTP